MENPAKTHQSNGDAIPLAEGQIMSKKQFRIYWRPGKLNYADYWTKHHPAAHHKGVRKEFITPNIVLEVLPIEQGIAAAAVA